MLDLATAKGAKGMAVRPKSWTKESRRALLKLTACFVTLFLVQLVVDYLTDGPERLTASYLTVRPLAFAFFWLIGAVLIWRWGYIRALRRQNDPNRVKE
ncbi:hypothetical protein ACIBKY_37275 [Nonomuraea sp. NPDC050394]|uniref:hypothetical protein n=1 Tax=Nonomuraea sp. NPDC050394 TaxID=3364363 RepID=UPI0037AAEB85